MPFGLSISLPVEGRRRSLSPRFPLLEETESRKRAVPVLCLPPRPPAANMELYARPGRLPSQPLSSLPQLPENTTGRRTISHQLTSCFILLKKKIKLPSAEPTLFCLPLAGVDMQVAAGGRGALSQAAAPGGEVRCGPFSSASPSRGAGSQRPGPPQEPGLRL